MSSIKVGGGGKVEELKGGGRREEENEEEKRETYKRKGKDSEVEERGRI